jgi:signal transduction histidine kinase
MKTRRLFEKVSEARGPLVLLCAALAASSLLAYQAIASERGHRRVVDETLGDLTAIAVWEANRAIQERLQHALNMTLWPANRLGSIQSQPPSPTILTAASEEEMECDCPLPLPGQFYFRLDLPNGDFISIGERAPDSFAPDLRSTLAERFRSRSQPEWRSGTLVGIPVGQDRRLVAVTVLPDASGAPAAAYGAVVDFAALNPVIETALREAELLPPAVNRGLPYDSLFVVSVEGRDGTAIFRSGNPDSSGVASVATLGPALGDLELKVGLRPDRAGLLPVTPNSRTNLLWALLVAVVVFFALAFVQLYRRQQLLALQNRFIAGVSHELRTPLAQIRMFSQTLRLGRERTEAERQQFLEFLDEDAQRLGNLVENILRFQRSQNGRDAVSVEDVEVDALIDEVVHAFEQLAAARGVSLEVAAAPDLVVTGDRAALHQVLLNLLDNAVKYGPEGQTVRISATGGNGRVRIAVADEGPGVPSTDRERIFQPFERLDRREERVAGGTGLGLAVVADLVGRLHGAIRVTDRQGGGATFTIEFANKSAGTATTE